MEVSDIKEHLESVVEVCDDAVEFAGKYNSSEILTVKVEALRTLLYIEERLWDR